LLENLSGFEVDFLHMHTHTHTHTHTHFSASHYLLILGFCFLTTSVSSFVMEQSACRQGTGQTMMHRVSEEFFVKTRLIRGSQGGLVGVNRKPEEGAGL
jgi:hypothetical protein